MDQTILFLPANKDTSEKIFIEDEKEYFIFLRIENNNTNFDLNHTYSFEYNGPKYKINKIHNLIEKSKFNDGYETIRYVYLELI